MYDLLYINEKRVIKTLSIDSKDLNSLTVSEPFLIVGVFKDRLFLSPVSDDPLISVCTPIERFLMVATNVDFTILPVEFRTANLPIIPKVELIIIPATPFPGIPMTKGDSIIMEPPPPKEEKPLTPLLDISIANVIEEINSFSNYLSFESAGVYPDIYDLVINFKNGTTRVFSGAFGACAERDFFRFGYNELVGNFYFQKDDRISQFFRIPNDGISRQLG